MVVPGNRGKSKAQGQAAPVDSLPLTGWTLGPLQTAVFTGHSSLLEPECQG